MAVPRGAGATPGRWRGALRRLVPPSLVAVVLWVLGRQVAAAVLVGVAAVVAVVGLLRPDVGTALDRWLGRLATGVGRAVGVALAALAWVVVVLPTWALGRLVHHSPLVDGWSSDVTAWRAVSTGRSRLPDGTPALVGRLGSVEAEPGPGARRSRRRRNAVLLGAVLVLGLVLARPLIDRIDLPGPRLPDFDLRTDRPGVKADLADDEVTWVGLPVDAYAHEGEPWAKDFFRELIGAGARHDLVLGQRPRDFRGEHLNVVDGRRASWTPEDPRLTVWFFGGSTMFGIAQRDDHTIPSEVARLAAADGIRLRAVNHGASGDVNWVATLRMAEALASEPAPDLVVFYDGSNEHALALERMDWGSVDPSVTERFAPDGAERRVHLDNVERGEVPTDPSERERLQVSLAAAQYGRGVAVARDLAAANGVPVVHFWQPQPFATRPSRAMDTLWERLGYDPAGFPAARARYDAMRERSGADPVDLSRSLDGVDRPVYFDSSHTNELGARVVARAMYGHLAPLLAGLDAGRADRGP